MHPNEEIARRLFSAFEANDMATIDAVLADDVVWNAPGRGVNSGIRRGKQQLFAGMGRLGELTDGTLRGDIHDLLASDDHAVVLQTTRGDRAGHAQLEDREAIVLHVRDNSSWRSGSTPATSTRWTPSSPDAAAPVRFASSGYAEPFWPDHRPRRISAVSR